MTEHWFDADNENFIKPLSLNYVLHNNCKHANAEIQKLMRRKESRESKEFKENVDVISISKPSLKKRSPVPSPVFMDKKESKSADTVYTNENSNNTLPSQNSLRYKYRHFHNRKKRDGIKIYRPPK